MAPIRKSTKSKLPCSSIAGSRIYSIQCIGRGAGKGLEPVGSIERTFRSLLVEYNNR